MDLKIAVKGIDKTIKRIERDKLTTIKNMNTAFRIEGFRLKNLLQQQIREGAPGGRRFPPLSVINRRWGRSRKNDPLKRMALGVRYHVPNTNSPVLQVGYVGPLNRRQHAAVVRSGLKLSSRGGYRGIAAKDMTSKSWRRLAERHQEGYRREITPSQRMSLLRRANRMNKNNPARRVFFLKKSTTHFNTPKRAIIAPFWAQQQDRAVRNIRANFKKKMRGINIGK